MDFGYGSQSTENSRNRIRRFGARSVEVYIKALMRGSYGYVIGI